MELRVELRGFEPLTFCMPCSRVSSDGVVLGLVTAVQSGSDVWGRLARSGEIWGRWYLVWSWFCRIPHGAMRSDRRLRAAGSDLGGAGGFTRIVPYCACPPAPPRADAVTWISCRDLQVVSAAGSGPVVPRTNSRTALANAAGWSRMINV